MKRCVFWAVAAVLTSCATAAAQAHPLSCCRIGAGCEKRGRGKDKRHHCKGAKGRAEHGGPPVGDRGPVVGTACLKSP